MIYDAYLSAVAKKLVKYFISAKFTQKTMLESPNLHVIPVCMNLLRRLLRKPFNKFIMLLFF